jgi:anti-anti-sigma factor
VNVTTDGLRTIVALHGEIDMSVAPQLRVDLESLVADGHLHLVLDLTALDFIDSSGLSAFIAANRAVSAAGGDLRLRSPQEKTMKVLETTRLTDLIPVDR